MERNRRSIQNNKKTEDKSVKIAIHIGKTVNIGNYESFRIDLGYDEDVLESEAREQYNVRFKELKELMNSKIIEYIEENEDEDS